LSIRPSKYGSTDWHCPANADPELAQGGSAVCIAEEKQSRTIADLAGHTVTATSGTTNIRQLNDANRERSLHRALMPVESHKDAFQLVTEGRAAAFVMDGILLAAMVEKSEHPEDYVLTSWALGWPEPYGLMVRIEDTEFKAAINDALVGIYSSGKIERLHEKWFNMPVAPDGTNMRLPMSEALKAAFSQDPVE
jgi:glutamate/aspartate transport system substrate-binding protein